MVLDAESGLEKNTIAISTFMYPPQLAWFSHNGRIPYPEYVNQKEKIDWLNHEIKVLNGMNEVFVRCKVSGRQPGTGMTGMESSTKLQPSLTGGNTGVRKSQGACST